MVSLKWGDALSIFLPGTVVVLAAYPHVPLLEKLMNNLLAGGIGAGAALLVAATLAGGILEAVTRITWERYWLIKRCPSPDVLSLLNKDNIDLYERGVQSSYKWVTFYANLAWATILLLSSTIHQNNKLCSVPVLILLIVVGVLLRASHVQWTYFVNYITKVFRREDAEKRSAARNKSQISQQGEQGSKE